MRKCSIYCFTNLINHKQYIGSTVVPSNIRYNQHIYNSTHTNAHQYEYPLYQAMRKYGLDNFKFEVLLEKECEEEEIRDIEKEYIIKYNTLSPNGYNQTLDTKHPINSIQAYKKMSETKRENAKDVAEVDQENKILNIWRSIADCAEATGLDEKKIAACCRGEIHTTEKRIFYWIDNNGELIIPEYIIKNSFNYKGKAGTTQKQKTNRKVMQKDLKTGEIIAIYDSIALASRETGCDNSGISKVCRGNRSHCGGFKWEYVNE